MDEADLEALRETVRGVCARQWPAATSADDGDLCALWDAAVRQGWTGLVGSELIPAAVAVEEELGRLACPLPILDIALVATLADRRSDASTVSAIADGTVRPAIGLLERRPTSTAVARYVEAGPAISHLLTVDEDAGLLDWYEVGPGTARAVDGLAVPAWSEVELSGPPQWSMALDDARDLLLLRRLGLASRAASAVRRTHELAVGHAGQREQFGRLVGSFQAVSHRLVDVQTALTAASQLRSHALGLVASNDPDWRLATLIYVEYVGPRLARLQFDSHHTLAAVGYFEEHEAPWLFRRAHADLAVLSAMPIETTVGEAILDQGAQLPELELSHEAEQLRRDVLAAFAPWRDGPPSTLGSWDDGARRVLRDNGWIGVGWPAELGGRGCDLAQVLAFSEAIAYADPPLGNIWMGINSIVPMLIKVGPPALRDLVMDEARTGELSIALGYSEPGAGSDLASLRTRADRVDGGWLVNGQKMWGTCVPDSKWIMLAARTDPAAVPAQAGITLFLVDLDSPGITVSAHRSLGGDVSATTFWDDVFVPDERVVGEVGQGWSALSAALAAERVLIGASVMKARYAFDRLVAIAIKEPSRVLPARRGDLRHEIGRLAVELQAARGLVSAAVGAMTTGAGGRAEAPMAKVMATELAEELNATAVALLGADALYGYGVSGALGEGTFEDGLRTSIMGVIAGGTGDIQRNLIARGMGLPR